MKYRKKPVVIEAKKTGGDYDYDVKIMAWCGGQPTIKSDDPNVLFVIPTLEGNMKVNSGDYIIQGVKGEFYPCKPDIFLATYEPAE